MENRKELSSNIANYFKLLCDNEHKVDVSRQVLCEEEEFEAYFCFRLLDTKRKGYITPKDIYNFLQQYLLRIKVVDVA